MTLTEHGHVAIADGYAIVQDDARRWTALVGHDDMATLIELLDRLVAAVLSQDPDTELFT